MSANAARQIAGDRGTRQVEEPAHARGCLEARTERDEDGYLEHGDRDESFPLPLLGVVEETDPTEHVIDEVVVVLCASHLLPLRGHCREMGDLVRQKGVPKYMGL